jgi:actin related protein 2/3 complex subunit 3
MACNIPLLDLESQDIISEAMNYYRINIFFKNYEIKNPADRLIVFLTILLNYCLKLM